MSTVLPNPKELVKLANACRKAGIKHFKCGEYEFTLSDDLAQPTSAYRRKKAESAQISDIASEFETDSLTDDQLLMWSTGSPDGEMEIKGSE